MPENILEPLPNGEYKVRWVEGEFTQKFEVTEGPYKGRQILSRWDPTRLPKTVGTPSPVGKKVFQIRVKRHPE